MIDENLLNMRSNEDRLQYYVRAKTVPKSYTQLNKNHASREEMKTPEAVLEYVDRHEGLENLKLFRSYVINDDCLKD